MAELTHLYVEQNTAQTTTSNLRVDVPGTSITPVANTKYLIIARALVGCDSDVSKTTLEVRSLDDIAIEAKSKQVVEHQQTAAGELLSYMFVHSFTTDASPDNVRFRFSVEGSSTMTADQASLLLLDLDAIGTEGTDYYENSTSASADDLSQTADTTILAQIAGSNLNQDEHLILGYGRADLGNNGKYFDIDIHVADDTATSAFRGGHRAEGEDTAEQRLAGFAVRHKASSGTPDVTIYGQTESGGGGKHKDGGGYVIALPTSLFADFDHDYQAGSIAVPVVAAEIASVGPITPSVGGNHLFFGGYAVATVDNNLQTLHLEDGTTDTRTGDATPSHNQVWDSGKDLESFRTFERISFSTSKTYRLMADADSAGGDGGHRWLVIVNLNEPAALAAVYPPFPRRRQTTVRM